ALGGGDRSGQEPPGQLVLAWREADRELARRASVELGGPARSGSAAAGWAGVGHFEQAVLDELVEMELGHVAGHARAFGRLVAVDRGRLGDHVAVQGAPDWLAQRGDAGDLRVEVGA